MSESDSECELTGNQKAFLKECLEEFADRFTDKDEEYRKAYERGISTPPIMCPWYGRPRLTAFRRGNRNSYQGRQHDRDRYDSRYSRNDRHRDDRPRDDRKYRPY